jgi:hypothetical protein
VRANSLIAVGLTHGPWPDALLVDGRPSSAASLHPGALRPIRRQSPPPKTWLHDRSLTRGLASPDSSGYFPARSFSWQHLATRASRSPISRSTLTPRAIGGGLSLTDVECARKVALKNSLGASGQSSHISSHKSQTVVARRSALVTTLSWNNALGVRLTVVGRRRGFCETSPGCAPVFECGEVATRGVYLSVVSGGTSLFSRFARALRRSALHAR